MITADLSAACRVEQLWTLLAGCPPEAIEWAGLGWAVAHAERDLESAIQLGRDGWDAAALARDAWRTPRFAELQRRRGEAP